MLPLSSTPTKTPHLLELASRKRVYDLVRQHPGCHYREIERRSGMPHGTLSYHLHFLVRHEMLATRKEHKVLRYFPKEISSDEIELLSLLRQQSLRRIIARLALYGPSTHDELALFTKLSPSTVSWHTSRLARDKVIRTYKEGSKTRYELALDKENVIRSLIFYRESLFDSLVNKVMAMWDV